MMTISLTTIIAGAVVVLLAVLGSLINPFLRSLHFPEIEEADVDSEGVTEDGSSNESKSSDVEIGANVPVSVLITAHDNLAELERNLPMFLNQKHAADYQVIVVCQSTDGETQDYLKRMAAENPHLYYTYIPESSRYMSRKKLQITLGVKAAKYEWIILTEPTCKPENDKWLATMARNCQDPNHLVLGYVSLDNETKSVRRFDSIRKAFYLLRRAQHSYGYRSHMPNVAFRKSDFMREQGYQGNLEYVRGEYDFLVNKYAAFGDTAVELDSDAWLTRDEPTNKAWHNAHLYHQASLKSLERAASMRTLMFFDHLMPHLSAGIDSRIGIRHLHAELDSNRHRRFLPAPALRPPHAHRQQGHQALRRRHCHLQVAIPGVWHHLAQSRQQDEILASRQERLYKS